MIARARFTYPLPVEECPCCQWEPEPTRREVWPHVVLAAALVVVGVICHFAGLAWLPSWWAGGWWVIAWTCLGMAGLGIWRE